MKSELIHFTTSSKFEEVYSEIKSSIIRSGFLLLHEIDTQKILANHGYNISQLKQLLCYHPKYVDIILMNDSLAINEVPIKIVIYQLNENEVEVSVPDPEAQLKQYNGLIKMGTQVKRILKDILGQYYLENYT